MIAPQVLAERALQAAAGLEDAIAIVRTSSRADLRWARTTLTTNGESRHTELTLIGFAPTNPGMATATLTVVQPTADDLGDLAAGVAAALAGAPAAPDAFPLVQPDQPAARDWADPAAYTSSAALDPLAAPLGEVFAECSTDGIELFGYAEHSLVTTWLASSTGLRLRHAQPAARLEITAKSHQRSRSAWWGHAGDDFAGIDLAPGATDLRRGLQWQSRNLEIPPGRRRVILTPSAVGDLMVDLWWSATARQAVEGRSVFSGPDGTTRIGSRLSRRALSLASDAHDPVIPAGSFLASSASGEAASVFDDGMPLGRVAWIRDGVLEHLHAPRHVAQEHRLPLAISADTLRMEDPDGTGDLDSVIARTDDGLLITCLWYNRLVDPQTLLLTGLTRDGVYVVRGGEVIGSTTNFRFNDSPVSLLDRITDAGSTVRTLPREMGDYAPRVAMPATVVEDFHLSTASDAR
ncbi:MAG: hypothetical protein KGP12_00670 [Actinomycetales bacterium]|nr:hypothetical protein [Actinomycetales bacterium]